MQERDYTVRHDSIGGIGSQPFSCDGTSLMMFRSPEQRTGSPALRDSFHENVIRASMVIGLTLTTVFAVYSIITGEQLDTFFNALSAFGLAIGLAVFQWKKMFKVGGFFAILSLLPLLLYDVITASGYSMDILWSLLLPVIAILLLGRVIGSLVLSAYWLTAAVLLFTVSRALSPDIKYTFLILFGVITFCIWLLETFRIRAFDLHIESERAFRAFVDELPQIIFEFDDNGRFTYVNEPALRAFGYSRDDLKAGVYAAQMFPPEDRDKALSFIRERMQNREPAAHEYTVMRKDGSRFPVLIHSNPVVRDGRPLGLRGIVVDITGLKHEQAEKEALRERLHLMEKMDAIGKLAGGIAHDFNNQLAGINGFAELIIRTANTEPPEKITGYAARIKNIGTRVAELTSHLLAFARKGKYLSVPVDIHRIIDDTCIILERSIDKRIHIERTLSAPSPVIEGDPSQLQSMLLDLAINARDAMPSGGTLSMTTSETYLSDGDPLLASYGIGPGSFVRLAVKDTGIGMTNEVQQRMFEPFFTTKGAGVGTGIGLAAVYGTVRNHKGCIDVKSATGAGSEIAVYLPLAHERTASAGAEPPVPDRLPPAAAGTHVLIVDDEMTIRDLIFSLLTAMGYQVTRAADGIEAESLYRDHWRTIDIVLLDMMMPRLGGRATWERLRAINRDVKVILISGYSIEGDAQEMLAEGVQGFLQKPFEVKALAAEIHRISGNAHPLTPA
ncbi:MAG: PAS domain S-box protein [Spirochaetota bacterium]